MGVGMMYSPARVLDFDAEEWFLSSLIDSSRTLIRIKKLIQERGAQLKDNYGHEIYRCPSCHNLYNHFFLHLDYQGGSYEIPYKCPQCSISLEVIDYDLTLPEAEDDEEERTLNLTNTPCPKCGKKNLCEVYPKMIMWD